MLSNVETRVDWDDRSVREIEEAKTVYRQARIEGRVIVNEAGEPLEHFSSRLKTFIVREAALSPTQFSMRVLDETGDSRIIWDSGNKNEVKDAERIFREHLQKGGKIYAIDDQGRRGQRVYGFDADHEELVIDERGTLEKLSAFAAKFGRRFTALPRTYPG